MLYMFNCKDVLYLFILWNICLITKGFVVALSCHPKAPDWTNKTLNNQ